MPGFNAVGLHTLPVMIMLAMLCLRMGFQWRRGRRTTKRDRRGLQAVLRAELAALRELYERNLRLLAGESSYVLSGRTLLVGYKANLGRLAMLDEDVIARVVAAYACNERTEGLIAAGAQGNGQLCWKLRVGPGALREIQRQYLAGLEVIDAAIAALSPTAGQAPQALVAVEDGQPCPASALAALPATGRG